MLFNAVAARDGCCRYSQLFREQGHQRKCEFCLTQHLDLIVPKYMFDCKDTLVFFLLSLSFNLILAFSTLSNGSAFLFATSDSNTIFSLGDWLLVMDHWTCWPAVGHIGNIREFVFVNPYFIAAKLFALCSTAMFFWLQVMCFYFVFTVFATVGFGDIYAVNTAERVRDFYKVTTNSFFSTWHTFNILDQRILGYVNALWKS